MGNSFPQVGYIRPDNSDNRIGYNFRLDNDIFGDARIGLDVIWFGFNSD